MIGVDLGGTFTKVCIITDDGEEIFDFFPTQFEEVKKYFVPDNQNNLTIPSRNITVKRWRVTGGGAHRFRTFLEGFALKPEFVDELGITAKGAKHVMENEKSIHLFGKNKIDSKFLMISMGTGVSFTIIEPGKKRKHVAGSAIGGGTLMGLSRLLLGIDDFDELLQLASKGKTSTCDLFISDVYGKSYGSTLTMNVCASSFGKAAMSEEQPPREDIAASLITTVCYGIGCQAAAVCTGNDVNTILFVGGCLASCGDLPIALLEAAKLYRPDVTVVVPDNSRYIGAIGCAID